MTIRIQSSSVAQPHPPIGQMPLSVSRLQSADSDDPSLRQAFQDFVAGTFYKQMIKALRSTQGKHVYMYGGMAEDMFRAHLDQQVAEDLAHRRGQELAGPMFAAFARQLGKTVPSADQAAGHIRDGGFGQSGNLPLRAVE